MPTPEEREIYYKAPDLTDDEHKEKVRLRNMIVAMEQELLAKIAKDLEDPEFKKQL